MKPKSNKHHQQGSISWINMLRYWLSQPGKHIWLIPRYDAVVKLFLTEIDKAKNEPTKFPLNQVSCHIIIILSMPSL